MFSNPSAAGRRSAELGGRVGNRAWGLRMLAKRGGSPNIVKVHAARRFHAYRRRLLKLNQNDWMRVSEDELAEFRRLARLAFGYTSVSDQDFPDDKQIAREGRKRAR
ncbi:MAG TPA: hypothetical protein VEI50_12040 [Nitrospiraceae bacterium]|nr:hypothetical protein [Nitrospiraceae bacterium]